MLSMTRQFKAKKSILGNLPVNLSYYASLPCTGANLAPAKLSASYLGLPAKLSGIPNYQQYRIGPGAELQSAILTNADLRWTNFRSANLKGAKLRHVMLWGATLAYANLSNADLSHADLTGADLAGANLENAQVKGASFMGARYSEKTIFPDGFGDPQGRGMVSLTDASRL